LDEFADPTGFHDEMVGPVLDDAFRGDHDFLVNPTVTDFDFASLTGLTREVKEKLLKIRPFSLGQASRISGVTPAAISILMVNLKKQGYL
jgi:hypothetical protein